MFRRQHSLRLGLKLFFFLPYFFQTEDGNLNSLQRSDVIHHRICHKWIKETRQNLHELFLIRYIYFCTHRRDHIQMSLSNTIMISLMTDVYDQLLKG